MCSPVLFIAAVASVVLFRSAYSASNLEIVPDSVEYAVAGNRIATEGSYDIVVNGQRLPPRYPPWFSLFVIAPAYLILGPEPGNAIYPVTCFGILGIITAFLLGRRISGNWGGLLASLVLLSLPAYRCYGRQVMTDVPCAVLVLLECVLYIRLRTSSVRTPLAYAWAGILGGLCAILRPVCYSVVLPFSLLALSSRPKRRAFLQIALLLIPGLAVTGANMAYNTAAFGSPFRTGYNFWCPVPYDYPALTFSISYIGTNLRALLKSGLPGLALAVIIFFVANQHYVRHGKSEANKNILLQSMVEFIIIGTGPIIVSYLFYFYPDQRFYLPSLSVLAVLAGSIVGTWMLRVPRRAFLPAQVILLAGAIILRFTGTDKLPQRRIVAERIIRHTPEKALIISSIDPAYLEFLACRSSQRRIMPVSRRVEYASKVVAPDRIENLNPAPMGWWDHRCEGLLKGGAREVVSAVAAERPDMLVDEFLKGVPVYLDTSHLADTDAQVILSLQRQFRFIRRAHRLYELAQ